MADFSNNLLFGVPSGYQQRPRFTPEGISALQNLLKMGGANLQDPYQGFAPIEQQARTQFQTKTIPSLAERFTAMGGNEKGSSAFQGALGSAASGLEENLAALRSQYGFQNRNQALQQLQLGLQPQYENLPIGGQRGFIEQILPTLLDNLPELISAGANIASGGTTGAVTAGANALTQLFKYLSASPQGREQIGQARQTEQNIANQDATNQAMGNRFLGYTPEDRFRLGNMLDGSAFTDTPSDQRLPGEGAQGFDINNIFKWLSNLGGSTPTDSLGRPLYNKLGGS